MSQLPIQSKERFVFIDGLRGFAAAGVMFFHLYIFHEFHETLQAGLPSPLTWLLAQGAQGVPIFFVISGFVIAYSLRSTVVTAASAGNFILRRQIRLDPVYWVCIAGTVIFRIGQALVHPIYWPTVGGPLVILANMFYLQNILHQTALVFVAWTLCLEIQFYLLYILLLFLVQRTAQRFQWPGHSQGLILLALVAPLMALSLWRASLGTTENAYFLQTWYLFAMGVLICWIVERKLPALPILALVGLLFARAAYQEDARTLCGCATAAAIFAAWRAGGLTTWLGDRLTQYFGRISYSLYLVHFVIGRTALRIGIRLSGQSTESAVFWCCVAAGACVGVAHLLHVFVERPTMRLASRLKPRPAPPPPQPIETVPLAAAIEAT